MSDRERAEAEASLKKEMERAGEVRTGQGGDRRSSDTVSLDSYAGVRSAATQENSRTIERYVAVGESTESVKDALDTGLLTFAAAADVAGETPDVQQPADRGCVRG